MGANSVFLELIPFQKGTGIQESKHQVTNVVSLVKHGGNPPSVSSPLKSIAIQFVLLINNDINYQFEIKIPL